MTLLFIRIFYFLISITVGFYVGAINDRPILGAINPGTPIRSPPRASMSASASASTMARSTFMVSDNCERKSIDGVRSGQIQTVWAASVIDGEPAIDGSGGVIASGDSLALRTSDGWLRLDEVQPSGGKRMSGAAFRRGLRR